MDLQGQNGLLSTYRESYRTRGPLAWLIAATLVGFYTVLYWEEKLSGALGGHPLTWLAESLHLRNRWYLYGFLYCVAMTSGGIYYLRRHGNSRYNRARIAVNVGVQVALGFTLPFVMPLFGQPEFYFSYFWPLKYDYLYPQTLVQLPVYLSVYAVFGGLLAAPVLAYFYGKRWYCSWVCGCGGLAETLGDPYRQLSDKSMKAWKIERYMVHGVLVFAILMTAFVLYTYFTGQSNVGPISSYSVRAIYGFWIGALFSGIVGVGFYPFMGNRVWCRFGCPLAAYLGLVQRFKSRFRITTNGGQCISCGNCSTYCEMGIDVRAYAQKGQDIVRASCVGCGICSAVCPRGVLNLENADPHSRVMIAPEIMVGNEMPKIG